MGLCVAVTVVKASAAESALPSYAEELVERAKALRLSEQEQWKRLLHYRKTWYGGWVSEADGQGFFLSQDGKSEPEAELEATIRGLFAPEPADGKTQHPLCRFPARVLWLDETLTLDWKRIAARRCPGFEEFLGILRPRGFSLVFSSYYMNNPSSALGHTFLRVLRTKTERKERADLLDYGVDFAANVDTTNALLYGLKGLAGMFPGQFKRVPYYYKVREYNDHDSRDIWEYELNFTPRQTQMVVAHLWELGSTYFDYFYMSENCSYHILGALQVADPKLSLLDEVGWPVVPADTVKALYRNPGLVRNVDYRPSISTQFSRRLGVLTSKERDQVLTLMVDPKSPFPADFSQVERVRTLDATLDLVDIKFADELLKERQDMDKELTQKQQVLLERRAEDLVPSEETAFAPPFRLMPHIGHDSRRVGMGSGYRQTDGFYHTLNFRLALHDLADPIQGYLASAQIEFLPTNLRYYAETERLRLEQLSLVRVRSLSPISRFDKSLSWIVDLGMRRLADAKCLGCTTGFFQVGGGYSFAPFGSWLNIYTLVNAQLELPVRRGALLDFARFGVGPWGGFRIGLSDQVTWLNVGSWSYLPGQEPKHTWEVDSVLRVGYAKDFAFGVEGRLRPEEKSLQAMSYIYF